MTPKEQKKFDKAASKIKTYSMATQKNHLYNDKDNSVLVPSQ
jgi:hypothetical protein